MAKLNLEPNLSNHDQIYQLLMDMHDGCTPEESHQRNAKLILCLSNHIGDEAVIAEAIAIAVASAGERDVT